MTCSTAGRSTPRAATSVATRRDASLSRNALKARVRSACDLSPCSETQGKPRLLSMPSTRAASLLYRQKTMVRAPWEWFSLRRRRRLGSFSRWESSTMTFCDTLVVAVGPSESSLPMVTRTTSSPPRRNSSASERMATGQVAENMSVCTFGPRAPPSRTWLAMARTSFSKPMSNIRSASSSTNNLTRFIASAFSSARSSRRPGVATTMEARRRAMR
mmetsp:Transcript_3049/g.7875  ORF Transcript_3049/g.7875 Transcript_3049/m.7875 type:complete len:216 (-) Transcript_3049:510-1157(-)